MTRGIAQPLIELNTGKYFWGVMRSWHIWLTISPPSVNRLFRKYGIPGISQPYEHPWTVMGIALLLMNDVFWDVTPCGSCKK
jgi:hypothetical protein